MPVFSSFFLFGSLANISFPGTSGFMPEVMIITSILASSGYIILIVLVGLFLTTVGTFVTTLRLFFGHIKVSGSNANHLDINKLEFSILSLLAFLIVSLGVSNVLL